MNDNVLINAVAKALSKKDVEKLAKESVKNNWTPLLIKLSFSNHSASAFRSAWVLEYLAARFPDRFFAHLEYFLNQFPHQQNQSCRRHFTKILMQLTNKNASNDFKNALQRHPLVLVIDTTFEWLIDYSSPVAVRVNCLDILFNLANRSAWIADELMEQTQFLLKNGSAAMQSRGKRVLKKLQQNKISK